jgi:hypothetical protein
LEVSQVNSLVLANFKAAMDLRAKMVYWLRQFPFVYPLRIIHSCEEWIDSQRKQKGIHYSQRGPWYRNVFPAGFLHNEKPQTLGEPSEKAFYANRTYPTPKADLFYLQNSYLMGHKGLILTVNHHVFQEFSHNFGISTLKTFLRRNPFYLFAKNVKKVTGFGAVLISPESQNYYHWLNDVLSRIRIYDEVMANVDHFCIASNVPSKFLDVLKDFGIPREKILLVGEKEKLQFDHLYVASLPGSEGRSPNWAVDYLCQKLLKSKESVQHSEKIYFKRGEGAARRIFNESSIIDALKKNGFEIVDPDLLTIYEQIGLMHNAKIVIGAHGAALSNLIFTTGNTVLIELFSPDYFRTDCYYTLSSLKRINYWYMVGQKPQGANWGDIVINEELLLKTVFQFEAI